MTSRGRRAIFALAWIGLAALAATYVKATLRISGDLRLFLPAPRTPAQKLILDEVSEGPGSRLLMVAIHGATPRMLSETSVKLSAALRADPSFKLVANGANLMASIPRALLPYRYLLAPTLDRNRFDEPYLHRQLLERERELASPAASLLEPLIPSDPTLETLKVLRSWEPAHEPRLIDGVWFNPRGNEALMVVETAAPAFDPRAQRAALAKLESHFAAARVRTSIALTVTGPGAFSVLMQRRSAHDARLAGVLDTFGMACLMLLAYRRARFVVLGALPLATAGIAALAAVTALFGTVNGITIAFGFTLIGVAIDYPIFVFSHQVPGIAAIETARSIWQTLAIAVAGLSIAYLAFALSGVRGLEQLACFNVAGLAAAGLSTRYLLPRLLARGERDYGTARLPARLASLVSRFAHWRWLAVVLLAAGVAALALGRGPLWENDLSRLTPVPRPLLRRYATLQHELGQPSVRYLLAVNGSTAEQVLSREEHLRAGLARLVTERAVGGFEDAARYLPSARVQERRRAALPPPQKLATALAQALKGTAFRPGLFAPFLKDVARARTLAPLTPHNVAGTPLELTIGSLLLKRARGWTGLVTFTDVHDPAALGRLAAASAGEARLLDLKQASEDLVAHQRIRILWSMAAAFVLLALVVYFALRSVRRAFAVLTPMALTAFITVGLLHAAGVPLNLFHLIGIVLGAGLGLDYALFFERSARDPVGRPRTLHALLVCATAAFMVFAVLASSTLPVLRSIGVTVVLGVVGNFTLALMLIGSEATPVCSDTMTSPR